MTAGKMEWDPRPLPTGWSLGYDEENQRCCYLHCGTTPPSISYTHPLDTGVACRPPRSSRPLPSPPRSLPPYQPFPRSPSPSQKAFAPSKPNPQHTPKLSVAQQLYASSFANRGPSIPTVPPPSLEPQSPVRPSFYTNQVAPYVPSSLPALRPGSPASTLSSLSSMSPPLISSPAYSSSFEPQSPPYSERSFSDDPPQPSPLLATTSHLRGHSELLTPQRSSHANRSTAHSTPHPTRTLFPLTYIDTDKNKPREIRTLTTAAKAPLGSEVPGTTSTENPTAPVSSPPSQSGAQLASVPVSPPPHHHYQPHAPQHFQQQAFMAPVRPQSYTQSSPQLQPPPPQSPPAASSSAQPPKPTKPGKKQSGFMSSLGSSLASSLGQTATQAVLSSVGAEEEDEGDDNGIVDSLVSGFAALTAGGGGGDTGDPASTDSTPQPVAVECTPPPDPGVYYAQDAGITPQSYLADIQYASYGVGLPTIEFHHHSNNSGGGHNVNINRPPNTWSTGCTYPGQANLPTGAQQPYLPHLPPHTAPYQPQSPGWSPYSHR